MSKKHSNTDPHEQILKKSWDRLNSAGQGSGMLMSAYGHFRKIHESEREGGRERERERQRQREPEFMPYLHALSPALLQNHEDHARLANYSPDLTQLALD